MYPNYVYSTTWSDLQGFIYCYHQEKTSGKPTPLTSLITILSANTSTTNPNRLKLSDLLIQFMSNEEFEEGRGKGTMKGYKTRLNNLLAFERFTNRTFYIDPLSESENFDVSTAKKYKEWFCRTRATNNVTSASRAIEYFRRALEWSVENGKIKRFDLLAYSPKRDRIKAPVFLTEIERHKFFSTKFTRIELNEVRDLYLFQCVTGISYCDLWSWQTKTSKSGLQIFGNRGKSDQMYLIPADNLAKVLILKYNGKLPYYENQKYNKLLKELADELNIKKRLTTHTARKTFAAFMDEQCWSTESISRMLGHASVKTTELYYLPRTIHRIEMELELRKYKNGYTAGV